MTMTDWELYWNIVAYTTGTLRIILAGFLFYRFLKPFLPPGRSVICTGFAYTLVMIVLKFYPDSIDSMICYAVGITAGFLVMYLIDKHNLRQKLFLAVTWYLMEWLIWSMILIPWTCLYEILIMPREMMKHPVLQFILFIFMQIIHILLNIAGLSMVTRIIHWVYHDKRTDMSVRELCLMLTPVMTMLAGYCILHMYSLVYESDTGSLIQDVHPEHSWLQLLYTTVSFASVLTAIISYQHIKDSQRKETEDTILSRQLADMERHIHEVEQLYAHIRGLKHDMGNHVMILEQLYETSRRFANTGSGSLGTAASHNAACHTVMPPENTAPGAGCADNPQPAAVFTDCGRLIRQTWSLETETYLARLKQQVQETVQDLQSGNPVTDVILREKQKEALEKSIDFTCSFHYPQSPGVSAFDMGIVLSNALNNALEAAQLCTDPYIRISSYHRKHTFIIEIKNSMLPGPPPLMQNGLPLTTRTGGEHGFGLTNIRRVARNYRGDIDIVIEEDSFLLNVMLLTG